METRQCTWIILVLLAVTIPACATGGSSSMMQSPGVNTSELQEIAEAYYSATDVQAMRDAVEKARVLGPNSALYHDIAANLAKHEARHGDEFKHLEAALLNPLDESPLQHLWALLWVRDTKEQWLRSVEICEILAKEHPLNDVRRHAAFIAMYSYRSQNRLGDLDDMRENLGFQPQLSVIGPFDNDQGKGFDIAYPPESLIDTKASYQGIIVPVSWREQPPVRHYGDLDLGAMMHPKKWALAYAATSFKTKREGVYELRLSMSGPAKVWINDILVYSERYVERFLFEGVVIPVNLRKGVNRIVIKTGNRKGNWKLGMSITMPGGDVPEKGMFSSVALDTAYAVDGPPPVEKPFQTMDSILNRIKSPRGSLRSLMDVYSHMDEHGLDVPLVEFTEHITQKLPNAIVPQYLLAGALWDNGERGRTSDMLNDLDKKYGQELLLFPLKLARFLKQNKLRQKAHDKLQKLCSAHPEISEPCLRLSGLYDSAEWKEDRLRLLLEIQERFPGHLEVLIELAESYGSLKFAAEEDAVYQEYLRIMPNKEWSLEALYKKRLKANDLPAAEDFARKLIRSRPYYMSSWRRLGEVMRRMKKTDAAEEAYEKMIELVPTSPYGYRLLGELYYQQGKKDKAIEQWRRALECDPDNEKLAERLNYIDPPTWGPWADDVPDEERLSGIVKNRDKITFSAKADSAFLLDHDVCELKADGSTTRVTTSVSHAINDKGRDYLTKQSLPTGGRLRVLHAYAVDPKGRVHEASSIRGREIRFRKLKAGSTTVVQYQHDAPPSEYLSGYYSQRWWFQGFAKQFVDSTFILWAPANVKVSEHVIGDVKKDVKQQDSMTRYQWQVKNSPVPLMEPGSPSPHEYMWKLSLSTVPDWSMFQKWEKALLEDAMRTSPELEAVTKEVIGSATTPMEKLFNIQAYLEHDIRYQMDYEHTIAGVKPHAAPVVLARRYGDCKDKSVLFITMAKIAGIEARFALVQTRMGGPIIRELPMQQFNHAIVYVPSQKGIAKGRFFDPTVDGLDVQVMRMDDQGAWAFVLTSDHENYEWIKVPYQSPEMNFVKENIDLNLRENGSAKVDIVLKSQGMLAMMVRMVALNKKQFEQIMQVVVNEIIPGSRLIKQESFNCRNLKKPVELQLKAEVASLARREGRQLRVTVPVDWKPGNLLSLSNRNYDYEFPSKTMQQWDVNIKPPQGARIVRVPKNETVETKDFRFTRRFERKGQSVHAVTKLEMLSPRIAVKDFPEFRKKLETVVRMLKEEVVFKVAK